MKTNFQKLILRYAALKSQKEQSKNGIEEMLMIESQLNLTAEAIMRKATELALGKPD